jgi:hypothetical protein
MVMQRHAVLLTKGHCCTKQLLPMVLDLNIVLSCDVVSLYVIVQADAALE